MRVPASITATLLLALSTPAFAARDRGIVRPSSSAQTVQVQADGVQVKNPLDGETLLLDGSAVTIVFTVSGVDPALEGKMLMMAELLKDGVPLGPAHPLSVPLWAKPNIRTQTIGVAGGRYVSGTAFKTAAEGTGYRYRVSLYTGEWNSSTAVIASGLSGTFSLSTRIVPPARPVVTVSKPEPASSLVLNAGHDVVFQVKNADATLHGRLKYAVELVCGGRILGLAHPPERTMLAETGGSNNRVGVRVGAYYDPASGLSRTAAPGVSCQYRTTVYTGDWMRSPTTVASGVSGTFALKRARTRNR